MRFVPQMLLHRSPTSCHALSLTKFRTGTEKAETRKTETYKTLHPKLNHVRCSTAKCSTAWDALVSYEPHFFLVYCKSKRELKIAVCIFVLILKRAFILTLSRIQSASAIALWIIICILSGSPSSE